MRAALASYRDKEHAAFVLRTNKEALEITQGYFREAGIRHIDSNANFTFVETGHDIAEVQARFLNTTFGSAGHSRPSETGCG